jgi:tyrosyl-tRNA synthetase
MTMPLLEGTDGVEKMSKSLNNYIGINEPPAEIFGKIMSISDPLMFRYYELLTDITQGEIKKWQAEIQEGTINPKDLKVRLARKIVGDFWGEEKARQAAAEFDRIFKQKELPDEMLIIELEAPDVPLLDLLVDNGILPSRGEAKRLVRQGGISIDGQKIEDIGLTIALAIEDTAVLKIGKRKFYKLIRNKA